MAPSLLALYEDISYILKVNNVFHPNTLRLWFYHAGIISMVAMEEVIITKITACVNNIVDQPAEQVARRLSCSSRGIGCRRRTSFTTCRIIRPCCRPLSGSIWVWRRIIWSSESSSISGARIWTGALFGAGDEQRHHRPRPNRQGVALVHAALTIFDFWNPARHITDL